MRTFNRHTIEKLQAYVYALVDPRTGKPFYIGKGRGNRIFQHLENAFFDLDSMKSAIIREIKDEGMMVRHFIVRHGLTDSEALHVEAALIDFLEINNLSNIQSGHNSSLYGLGSTLDIFATYEGTMTQIPFKSVVFKINRMYKPGMTRDEIYEASRGIWRIAWDKHDPEYAIISVFGNILGIYKINRWEPANFERLGTSPDGRWMFEGEWADDLEGYLGASLLDYPAAKSQTPFFYINC